MASFVSRLVACLVAVVAVLQLVHLVLLNKLESRRLNELHNLQHHQHHPSHSSGINENLAAIAPLPPEEQEAGGRSYSATEDLFYNTAVIDNNNKMKGSAGSVSANGGGNSRTRKGNDGGTSSFVFRDESAVMTQKLLRDEDGAIVDSTGEYRIVFDAAGPKPDNSGEVGQSGPPASPTFVAQENTKLSSLSNTDDFLIDEDIFEPESNVDITLSTHSDLEGARRYLVPLVERWQGPVSLSLFAPNSSSVESIIDFVAQARLCSDLVRQWVTFHLVFPLVETHSQRNDRRNKPISKGLTRLQRNNKISQNNNNVDLKECQNFSKLSSSASGRSKYDSVDSGVANYPTNLLRNVARKRVLTDFSLVSDIDMLPSVGLRPKFQKFAREKGLLKPNGDDRKTVFVVPAFESKFGEAPQTKRQLLTLIDKYQARPFFFDLCWKCQMHTDYESWQREPGGSSKKGELSVLFEVLWKDPWEPFFISDNSVPLFDERFRTRTGFNRISQLCELHVAGYKFAVLNEAFLIHRGYVTHPTNSLQHKRNRDLEQGKANYRQFKNELKGKYPLSTRRCY